MMSIDGYEADNLLGTKSLDTHGPLQSSISNLFRFFSKMKQDHKEGSSQIEDTPPVTTADGRLGDGRKSSYAKAKHNVHTGHVHYLDSAIVTNIVEQEVSPF